MRVQMKVILLLTAGLLLLCCTQTASQSTDLQPGQNVTTILNQRGYQCTDYFLTTTDYYVLNLVRCRSPFANATRRGPVIFVHGILSSGQTFLKGLEGVRPKDRSYIEIRTTSLDDLLLLLASDPNSFCFPCLTIDHGYDTWFLNRRGCPESRGYVGPPPADPLPVNLPPLQELVPGLSDLPSNISGPLNDLYNLYNQTPLSASDRQYWNYSLDEQSKYDIKESIEYVLNVTGYSKLVYVGHSAGAGLNILTQANYPELALKLNVSILWAPAVDLGHVENTASSVAKTLSLLEPLFRVYIAPVTPDSLNDIISAAGYAACASRPTDILVCDPILDAVFGFSDGQNEPGSGFFIQFPTSSSTHEFVSFFQSIRRLRMYYYDYLDPSRNQIAYNSPTAPPYDTRRLDPTKVIIWYGNQDGLVTQLDTLALVSHLRSRPRLHLVGNITIAFNHIGFLTHYLRNVLLIIPSLKELGSS